MLIMPDWSRPFDDSHRRHCCRSGRDIGGEVVDILHCYFLCTRFASESQVALYVQKDIVTMEETNGETEDQGR
jgi:hypothetical protein